MVLKHLAPLLNGFAAIAAVLLLFGVAGFASCVGAELAMRLFH